MALETDLSASPFFDDFDASKNFHRVLFRPEVALQARELNQLQSILQNQVEKFGDNIFKDGTIIKGCNFTFDDSYYYVKLPDIRVDGQTTNPDQYLNLRVVDASSNLQAIVINTAQGLESQNPDLHTIYVKYQNSGSSGKKQFAAGDELTFYSNTNPTDTASLVSAYNVQVAPATLNSVATNPVGRSYVFSVSDGVIFQKGFFIEVANTLSTVVSKYSNLPDGVTVGFSTSESIITEYEDSTLYDNASGFTNENAPGAHRLKLTPTLEVVDTDSIPAENFFSLAEWQNGNVIKLKQQTEYSQLGRELAKRTYEESGNYVVTPFTVLTEDITSNTTHFNVVTSAGLAFVEGYRVENLNNRGVAFRKGTDTKDALNQNLNADYGNYVLVNELVGTFAFNLGATVSLRNTAAGNVTDETYSTTAPGSQIGTARLLSFAYDSGTPGSPNANYRMYLTDIQMNSGYAFSAVRSIAYDEATYDGLADVVMDSDGNATLVDSNKSSLVIPTSKFAITSVSDIDYVYKTSTQGSSLKIVDSTGATTITLSGTSVFPYGTGVMNSVNERQIVVVPQNAANVATPAKSGIVQANNNIVQGSGTSFVKEYDVDDYININNIVKRIVSIANNTYMTLSSNVSSNVALGNSHAKYYPANLPIPISERRSFIDLSNTSSMTIQLVSKTGNNETLSANLNVIAYYDVESPASSAIAKNVLKDQYVKIDTALFAPGTGTLTCNATSTTVTGANTLFDVKIAAGYVLYNTANVILGTVQSVTNSSSLTLSANAFQVVSNGAFTFSANGSSGATGPWSLGLPDVYNISAIYRTTNTTYTTTDNVLPLFNLVTGQKDGIYDLSSIELSPAGVGQVKNGDKFLVKLDVFKSAGVTNAGFYTKLSYPIDDVNVANTTAIRTIDIPIYKDSTGAKHSLRDSFDFRPQVSNTAIYTSSAATATANPSKVSSLASGERYIVSPEQAFSYSATYNVGRIDKLAISSLGEFLPIEGVPSDTPIAPEDFASSMTLAKVWIPPYPSLTLLDSIEEERPEHSIKTQTQQNRRYTMKDIANIDNRLSSVEYYTALNVLENKTKNALIKSDITGMDRFKNGIFVDDFSDLISADSNSNEFRIGYDPVETSIIPIFEQSRINMNYSTGSQKTGDIVTLPYTETEYMIQTDATSYRVCTEQVWNFSGSGALYPSYVYLPDPNPKQPDPTGNPDYIANTLNVSFCTDILAGSPFVLTPVVTARDTQSNDPRTEYVGLSEYNYGASMQNSAYLTPNTSFTSTFNNISNWPFAYFDAPVNTMYDSINRRFNLSAYSVRGRKQPTISNTNAGSAITFNNVPGQLAACWWGYIELPGTGTNSWTFYGTHDDGMALYIDGTEVFKNWTDGAARTTSGSISLVSGRRYPVKMYYYNAGAKNSAACILELSCAALSYPRQYAPYDLFSVPRASLTASIVPTVSSYYTIPTVAPGTSGGYDLTTQSITDYTKFVKRYMETGDLNTVAISKGNFIINEAEALIGIKAAINSGWLTKYGINK